MNCIAMISWDTSAISSEEFKTLDAVSYCQCSPDNWGVCCKSSARFADFIFCSKERDKTVWRRYEMKILRVEWKCEIVRSLGLSWNQCLIKEKLSKMGGLLPWLLLELLLLLNQASIIGTIVFTPNQSTIRPYVSDCQSKAWLFEVYIRESYRCATIRGLFWEWFLFRGCMWS